MKQPPLEAAARFIEEFFPDCDGAVLSGSVSRGLGTTTSDLDIVVIDESISSAYRKSEIHYGWMIELFVHSTKTYNKYFELDCSKGTPILPRMLGEGIILKDGAVLQDIRTCAQLVLSNGPTPWDEKTKRWNRYLLSDALDDFIGVNRKEEALFIAAHLADLTHEFILRMNNHWIGKSKWIYRELNGFDPIFTQRFVAAFDLFYKTGEKQDVIELVEEILSNYGGRLFEGYGAVSEI